MLAAIAAVLFTIAVVLDIANVRIGPLTSSVFIAAGLVCLSLQIAGIGPALRRDRSEPTRPRRRQ